MIIAFSGDEGSGKSTIAKKVAAHFGMPRYYMGQILRNMAKERGLSLVEFLKLGEQDPSIDKEVDDFIVKLAKEKDNFLIESRTAWYFIPQALKIYLKVDEREAARRIFKELQGENQRNEGKENELNSIEKVLEKIRERRQSDDKRYQKYYGINVRKEDNFDFVLDTTYLSIEEVFEKVKNFIKKAKKENLGMES